VLAELIDGDVERYFQGRRKTAEHMPSDVLVHYVASTFVLVLNWWIDTDSPLTAREVNQLFRALVVPVLITTLSSIR